jgi:hypothetical protein
MSIDPELLAKIQRMCAETQFGYAVPRAVEYHLHVSALLAEVLCPTFKGKGSVTGAMPGATRQECKLCSGTRLNCEVDQLRVQLAGVLVAAEGGTDEANTARYGWSPTYQAVLELRLKYDKLGKDFEQEQQDNLKLAAQVDILVATEGDQMEIASQRYEALREEYSAERDLLHSELDTAHKQIDQLRAELDEAAGVEDHEVS